jgi:transcriptional regulator with GAF, ATPase, and Fis domain
VLQPAREVVQENPTQEIAVLPLEEVERQHIQRTLGKTDWQISGAKGAARLLDMNPSPLRSQIKKLKLERI